MRIESTVVVDEKEAEAEADYVLVSGHDSSSVTIAVHAGADCAEVSVSASEAREVSVRLMQAADLADPEHATRYGQRW